MEIYQIKTKNKNQLKQTFNLSNGVVVNPEWNLPEKNKKQNVLRRTMFKYG
jgi:hypothetical protein